MCGRPTQAPPSGKRPFSNGRGAGLFLSAGVHLLLCCALAVTLSSMSASGLTPFLVVGFAESAGAHGGDSLAVAGRVRSGTKADASIDAPRSASQPDPRPPCS